MALQTDTEVIEHYLTFFKNFTADDGSFPYLTAIADMIRDGERSLVIDYRHMHLLDNTLNLDLTSTLGEYPALSIKMASEAVAELVKEEDLSYYESVLEMDDTFHARFSNVPFYSRIRDIRSNDLDTMKMVEGVVTRASEVRPLITEGVFHCNANPEHIIIIPQANGAYTPPGRCSDPTCKSKSFSLDQANSRHIDWQSITVQERPEDLPPGTSPKSLRCRLLDDIVDSVRPGDRVVLQGLVKANSSKPLKKGQALVFDIWIDTNFVESADKDVEQLEITTEEEARFMELAKDENIYEMLVGSIAPQVKGLTEIKEAILYTLFAGVDKQHAGSFKTRGQPNILIVGDPGVAKCVTGDTLVLLSDGSYTEIQEIVEEQLLSGRTKIDDGHYATGAVEIITLNRAGQTEVAKADIFWKRTSPDYLYEVVTEYGKRIKVTPTHPFFTYFEGGITTTVAFDLRKGALIATPRRIPLFEEVKVDSSPAGYNHAKTMGQFIVPQIMEEEQVLLDDVLEHFSQTAQKVTDIRSMFQSDIAWERVVRIRRIKSDVKWVYDLQVPETHNYVANDIFIHNSQLLRSVQSIAPRSIFTSGKGSSAAGLTAAISRDPDTGEMTLEAGAMVLADQGICVSGDAEILMADGSLRPISSIYEQGEEVRVQSFNPHSLELSCNRVVATSKRYSEELYELTFASGDILKATPEHPVPTWDNGVVWKQAGDVEEGDYLIDYREYPSEDSISNLSPDLAEWLGMIYSDGSLPQNTNRVSFYSTSEELLERFIQLTGTLFHLTLTRNLDQRNGVTHLYFYSDEIRKHLHDLGFPNGAKSKTGVVITDLLNADFNAIQAFVSGLINGDGSVSNRTGGGVVDITFGNRESGEFVRKLLRKIGVISKLRCQQTEGGGIVPRGSYEVYHLTITGVDNISRLSSDRLVAYKKANLQQILLRADKSNTIPLTKGLFSEISQILPHGQKQILYTNSIRKSTLDTVSINRANVSRALSLMENAPCETEEYRLLSQVIENKVHFNRVVSKKKVPGDFVYNLQVENDDTYFANFIPVHNCLIDEFDKMNENDRSAIHEAMEQHSYHPSVEIRLKNGRIYEIGEFVDELFDNYSDQSIPGNNCEILVIKDLDIKIGTNNFENIYDVNDTTIHRVSRHEAPNKLVKILFSNGREIIVTPEHEVFYLDNEISISEAENIKEGMYVPALRGYRYRANYVLNSEFSDGYKAVRLPEKLEIAFAKFLGYYASEGYSYDGSSAEVGLSTTSSEIKNSMINSIRSTFEIECIDNVENNRTLRIISRNVYNYLHFNFPELMKPSVHKRIPPILFIEKSEIRTAFLTAAFEGDGGIESEALCYNTSSKGLAEDYQDLLLSLGIQSRIGKSLNNFNNDYDSDWRYKVYIRGESICNFVDSIIPHYKDKDRIKFLYERSKSNRRNSDSLPSTVACKIVEMLKSLAIPYDGSLYSHIKNNNGINVDLVKFWLNIIETKVSEMELHMHSQESLFNFRKPTNLKQKVIADFVGESYRTIRPAEDGGYSVEFRDDILSKAKVRMLQEIEAVKNEIDVIKQLMKFRWLKVKKVELIQNAGEYETKWVYDVTIEKTKNFISQGLVLHNTVSIAKAGIVATLNSRTGVIAVANPKYGYWDNSHNFDYNVELSKPILSRFDLIYVLKDIPDEDKDYNLAEHILNLHYNFNSSQDVEPDIPPEDLRKYIIFAKQKSKPVLSKEAMNSIQEFYVQTRSRGKGPDETYQITITARQLEGIIRIAEARARAVLRPTVTKEDAERAIEMMKSSLEQTVLDPETGEFDYGILSAGISMKKRNRLSIFNDALKECFEESDNQPVSDAKVIEAGMKLGLSMEFIEETIKNMLRFGSLYRPSAKLLAKV